MRIVVASKNPVKINATKLAFEKMFPGVTYSLDGINFPSGVADQPMTDNETLTGALNRATKARAAEPNADFWVGLEGGLEEKNNVMEVFAWIIVLSKDKIGQSRTSTFELPEKIADLIRGGMELAHADDKVFGRANSGHENGSVGLMTSDVVTRTTYYEQAVILAFIPFKNPEFY